MAGSMVGVPLSYRGVGGSLSDREGWAEAAIQAAEADLVVFPEAFMPGYQHERRDLTERARRFAADQSRRHDRLVAIGYLDGVGCALGLASPEGGWWSYRKRFPTPDEAKVWAAGDTSVVAATPRGRVGLLICADILHVPAWTPLRHQVDVVAVAAAWPDYAGRLGDTPRWQRPVVEWLARESGPFRDRRLADGARYVGAPVVFANAVGVWRGQESFSGGSAVFPADRALAALPTPVRWRTFLRLYRSAAA